METRKNCMGRSRSSPPFLPSTASNEHLLELDEFEIWNTCSGTRRDTFESRMVMRNRSPGRRGLEGKRGGSLPVNVPDWSRILREENRRGNRGMQNEEEDESWNQVPPHESVARRVKSRRVASFSLYEGVGRTLKGRDLCKLRSAIWERVGFQD